MKKIITVMLSVLLIAGLFTGCNGESVEELFRGNTPTPTPTPEPVEYTVTFNSNGGSEVESQTVKEGKCAKRPESNPERDGFAFVNWCSDEALNVEYDFSTPVTSDITLYANWSPVPFRLVAKEPGVTINFSGDPGTMPSLKYRIKNVGAEWSDNWVTTWTETSGDAAPIVLTSEGDEVEIRASAVNANGMNCWQFSIDQKVNACGNIMFLIHPDGTATTVPDEGFGYLFKSCALEEAPALPATTVGRGGYWYMFEYCDLLTKAPALPATVLGNQCYEGMFEGCAYLTEVPDSLPATVLKEGCYNEMFYECASLVRAPALPATSLTPNCYCSMFYKCSSLTDAPVLPATTLADSCYYYMFFGCSALEEAPALPATTLAESCYGAMFYGCSQLRAVKVSFLSFEPESDQFTTDWLGGYDPDYPAPPTGTFTCSNALKENAIRLTCAIDDSTHIVTLGSPSLIPTGWTVVCTD